VTKAAQLSKATLSARRQESNSLQALQGNYFYLRILFTPKLSIMYEESIQLFSNMQELKKSFPTNSLEN
jgi:hypothetical protein